jgi:L-ascorbate metabolism protein UlaG (beta-lactamase superfamily)
MEGQELVKSIVFLGHASFRIEGGITVYTDPYQLHTDRRADLILITHSHFDHCSPDDVRRISDDDTVTVCSEDCAEQLRAVTGQVIALSPGGAADVHGVLIDAVPAYNLDKQFHPRDRGWNGYVIVLDGNRYYVPGDTDLIPEMADVRADVAFLPVGGTYTMDYRQAAEAARRINPQVAIPMHYGQVVGSDEDARMFAAAVGDRAVVLPVTG